jgi:hypothetical protein
MMKKKFEDLYSFIEDRFYDRDKESPLYLVSKFCETYNLNFNRLKKIVSDFGGHNDLEVILNVVSNVPGEQEIDMSIETPAEFAERNNLYCKWHTGGWVPCDKADKNAMPDLNRAYEKMFTESL